ncbi:MAG TPA: ribonuclease P, partial [Pyrodictium sp.]|nr:ribonuclease P [Pyrodictium sp.]
SHTTKYIVLAALGVVRRVNGKRVLIIPVRTTGTIKRAKKALQTWR